MPRDIRDSDEEVETKRSARRTRASSAVSSATVTDSPRRTTRSNKQLATIESSPESLDDSNTQSTVRKTRSRAATLEKSAAAGITKNLRSRKNSVSSNQSETIDLELETTQKRVTRKAAATATVSGTPTKTNLRSRNLRAGSEAKSTPPLATRSSRVTRASSVDPVNTPNESVGTPVRRRTRASMVPMQQTVTEEEEEAKNKTPESLNNTAAEIDGDSENESVSTKGKSNRKVSKNKKETGKDSTTEQSNLDTSITNEENMSDKSCTSNDSNEDSTLKALATNSITSELESFTSNKKENLEKIDQTADSKSLALKVDQNVIESDEFHSNTNENDGDLVKTNINDDECELVDVENFTLTDDSIDVVNSPKKLDTLDPLTVDIKNSYVKLDRTNLVEKIVNEKLEENTNHDNHSSEKLNDNDYSVSQSNVITKAKTAIVLVNDFVKSNEYFNKMKDKKIFDSGISLSREDNNSNTSVHNSDDQLSTVSIDESDEILSLKLTSPSEKESQNDKLIDEVLPIDEKNYSDKVTDESVCMNVNDDNVHNFSFEKSDVCLKNDALESELKSDNAIGEKNNDFENCSTSNIVNNEIMDIDSEIIDNLISENISKENCFKMIDASNDSVTISKSLRNNMQQDDSVSMNVDDNAIVSVNVKSSIVETNPTDSENQDRTKYIVEVYEIENVCDFSNEKSKLGSDESTVIEKNDSVSTNNIIAEQINRVNDTNEQLGLVDPSKSESNSKENYDITSPRVLNDTNSNEIEPKLPLEDKNGVPSAVTDADGDNASSPIKEEETHETSTDTTSTKSPEKSKRKCKPLVIDSDLDESTENLFQDIPAEEWSKEQSKRKSSEHEKTSEDEISSNKLDVDSFKKDKSVVTESNNEEDDSSTSANKSGNNENELDKSEVEITNDATATENQETDLSLLKKSRKSLEKKRESGQSSDSGIQDGHKTIVENGADENDNKINESHHKSRRSLDNSLKANQSLPVKDKNDSIGEKLSKSLVDRKSLNKSRKSLNNSVQFNVSVSSGRQSLSDVRKSIADEKTDENSEIEAMEIDEDGYSESEMNKSNDYSNKSRKSAATRDSITGESKIVNRLSLDKSLNKSSIERIQEEKVVDNEEIKVDSNRSTNDVINNKSLSNSQDSFNDENLLSTSSNKSEKMKKRLSEKITESTRKSIVEEPNEKEDSEDEEMDVDVVNGKSPNKSRKNLDKSLSNKSLNKSRKSLDESLINKSLSKSRKSLNESSSNKLSNKSMNEDESLKKNSNRKSADDDSELEVEPNEDHERKNKSTRKSLNASSKSPNKVSTLKEAENLGDSMDEVSPKKKKSQEATSPTVLDRSLQKSIERMKFSNPPKHDISTLVQVNSSSEDDSDNSRIPNFIFKLSDEEETKASSSEEEKEENDVDSDIEREYNLGGNSITKYSDDDVPGDDCRGSEEESSDNEDDGADLQDFVVPDDEVEDDDDEDDEDDDHDDDDHDGDEDEDGLSADKDLDIDESDSEDGGENEDAKVEDAKEKKINISKKNVSINSSQSTVKNTSTHLQRSGFSQSSGSESDDESTEVENKNSKERLDDSGKFVQDSKGNKSKNTSLQKKDKSMDKSSKSSKSKVISSSESDDESAANKSQVKAKEKSLNMSAKNKSLNLSKSMKDKSTKSENNKSVRMEDNDQTESSSTESDEYEATSKVNRSESIQIASPSETVSESEESEDYNRTINAESRDASIVKPKSKKLIECSTPNPGATKKTDLSKSNLSQSLTASRRKSGSLNNLNDTKMMSSRLSVGEMASKSVKLGDTTIKLKDDVEIAVTPKTLTETRQAWKLIPLNRTAHLAVEETPGTKYLKKAKLNDSFSALESIKSGDLSSATKKSKKALELEEPEKLQLEEMALKVDKKSKKRKLLDMSIAQSVDEDSILKISKTKKKRARFDDSTVSTTELEQQIESVEQSNKKKNKKSHGDEDSDIERAEEVQKLKKKKKKAKAKEAQVDEAAEDEDVAEKVQQENSTKKRKKKQLNAQEADEEIVENPELQKAKKKKTNVTESKQVEKQSSRQESEGGKAAKESLKKKQKDQADRMQKVKPAKSLKRLPEDVLDNLPDEPVRRPDKRQKLSRNKERSVIMPSKSMFSPGKNTPENLHVDDGYVPLSSAGGTTQFAVVNLRKAKKAVKKNAAVLNFRDKMLARVPRMPTSTYLSYLKKQKAKSNF